MNFLKPKLILVFVFYTVSFVVPQFAYAASNLVGYWKLDEGSGTSATDSSGNGNTGTLTGPTDLPTWSSTVPTTSFPDSRSLSFDGTDDYVDIPNNFSIKPNIPFTVSAWIKLTSLPGITSTIFATDAFNNNYYGFYLGIASNSSAIELDYGNGGSAGSGSRQSKISSSTISTGVWSHVVGVVRGAVDMSIYINGVDANGSYSGSGGTMVYSSNNSTIGRGNIWGGSVWFNGLIDDVRIYNRALSSTEITALAAGNHTTATWTGTTNTDYETATNSGTPAPSPTPTPTWSSPTSPTNPFFLPTKPWPT